MFFAAVRCLVICEASRFPETVLAVTAPFRSVIYGDRPFSCLTHEDYRKALGRRFSVFDLVGSGRTLAPGFPVTARELAVLYSCPTKDMLEDDRYPFDRARGIEYVPKGPVEGVYLGDNIYGKETPVIQDRSLRPLHLVEEISQAQSATEALRAEIAAGERGRLKGRPH